MSGAIVKAGYIVLRSITFSLVLVVSTRIDAESEMKQNFALEKRRYFARRDTARAARRRQTIIKHLGGMADQKWQSAEDGME